MPNIFGLILTCVIVVIVFSLLLFLIKRYKKCPSDKVMVIYGKVGSNKDGSTRSAKCIHGGAAFIWPVIQSYEFLDLTPMSISVDLENALSRQNIRINVPSRFTVGVSTEPGVMQNAAERLLGLKLQEIQELAKDIIFGQLRLVIATMDIEEINTDRDKFLEAVSRNVEGELKKIGLRLINVNGHAADFPRKKIDKLGEFVKTYKAKGLAWTRMHDGQVTSSYQKFLTEEENKAILERAGAKDGDLILIVGDVKDEVVFAALGALRCECAKQLGLLDPKDFKFLWVTEFPMFEYSEEEGRYVAMHHPFTAPMDEDLDKLETDKKNCRAKAYDIVLNGTELGGGSIRISVPETQQAMFRALGFSDEDAQERFGHLINAFKFGAPPHGGLAYGLDRLCMLMAGAESIRDVIAFPKVQNASDLMMACPDVVDDKQLDDLSLAVTRREEASEEE